MPFWWEGASYLELELGDASLSAQPVPGEHATQSRAAWPPWASPASSVGAWKLSGRYLRPG